jgi:hypothetical protein
VRLSTLLRKRHAMPVSAVQIMQARTVAGIVTQLGQESSSYLRLPALSRPPPDPSWCGSVPLVPVDFSAAACLEGFPLSAAQQQMWILYQMTDAATYNVAYVQRLRGALRVDVLVAAVRAAAETHAVLRTRYGANAEGEARQWVMGQAEWELPTHECTVEEEEVTQRIEDEVAARIDLAASAVRWPPRTRPALTLSLLGGWG